MGRFGSSNEPEEDAAIDISPLIDCIFILLIFFIVTTTFVEETGIEVDKPQAAAASALEKQSVMIAVTADGAIVYGGKEIGVSGVQPIVRRFVEKEADTPVIIQADEKAPTGIFARVLDEAKLGGAAKVSLSTAR
ncbi:MAG: biopolymer transporter ExbD [Verrucomicrobiaceae bacterium]|jgi:biopolymer transport protein ExbD|nr:biopolymer transporter ExbD [Verrucomicrobiaceae bacterium]